MHGRGLLTSSTNIFCTAARLWGLLAVFSTYLCENSPAEKSEHFSICPRLRAKALESDLSEDLSFAQFDFCA